MKKKHLCALLICTALFFIGEASVYYSMQPPFNYTGADGPSTCAQCHGNLNSGGGGIATSGLPTGSYTEGQQYDFSISLAHPATRGRWGFSIAARDANNQPVGNFSSTHPNAALNNGELSHFGAVFQTGTSFTYDNLKWTAPTNPTEAQKTVTFYYIGNAANGDRGLTGDFIYSGTKSVLWEPPANNPPAIAITSPLPGDIFNSGSTITVKANATDIDGSVNKVEFYLFANNTAIKLGEDITSPYELSGSNIEPGIYRVFAKATDNDHAETLSDTVDITVAACSGSGGISVYGYTNIAGPSLINLASHHNYPSNPDIITQLPSFEYGQNILDNYGGKVRGFICAPQTGNYIFYIASDEQSELWLSTDDNPLNIQRIAYVESRVAFRSWFSSPTQRSVSIRLIKGARYYIEAIHKEGTGNDHLSVSWLLPNNVFEAPIPGSRLSPWETPAPGITVQTRSFTESLRKAAATTEAIGTVITASPNPSHSHFNIDTRSNSNETFTILLTDVLGRIVERQVNVPANTIVQVGHGLRPGVYFAQVMQGKTLTRVKLIKE